MLAGDVTAIIQGNTLRITGDDLSNQIQLTQTLEGNTVVTGIDTSVNGETTPFTTTASVTQLRVSLGDGDDELLIEDYVISRNVFIFGGNGDDRLTLNDTQGRFIHIQGNDGDDVIELNGVIDRGSTYVFLGDGDDVLSIPFLQTSRNFKVFGGNGDDTVASIGLNVGRKFRLYLDNGNDQALLAGGTNVRRTSRIALGDGDDFLGVLPQQTDQSSSFRRHLRVSAGSGNDTIAFDDAVSSRRRSRVDGGAGFDAVDTGDGNLSERTRFRRFENTALTSDGLADLVDAVYARLIEVGIDSTAFGDVVEPPISSLQLSVAPSTLAFIENDPPLNIDAGLVIDGATGESIVSASVVVQGGQAANDALLFEDTDTISGFFDASTGTLSLIGPASLADYQAALRTVQFSNESDDPATDDRTITISLTSNLSDTSISADRQLQIAPVNDPLSLELPGVFDDQMAIIVGLDEEVSFTALGSDPDNPFVYQLDLDESGISAEANQPTIDPETGEFSFTPSEVGTFLLRVIATNDLGESDQEEFSVLVEDGVFAISEIEDQVVSFNESLEIPVQASIASPVEFELDVSGDAVAGTDNLPVISESGIITWTPDLLTSGTATFTVTATDSNQVSTSETFEVNLPGFQPFQGNRQLASVAPLDRNGIYGDEFQGSGAPFTIDQSLDYTATISTAEGDIVVSLFDNQTPISVNHFVNLAEDGYYDGLSFHRVVESPIVDENGLPVLDESGNLQFERFVAQAGDPTNTSTGGPGFQITDEILPELTFDRPGILAYARTNAPNSNGSQFFITYDATEFQNDEDFTIFGEVVDFGQVIDGLNALDRLNLTDPATANPATPTLIQSIEIEAS